MEGFLWESPGEFLCGWFCLMQPRETMSSDPRNTTTKNGHLKTKGECKTERANICPARFVRHGVLICGVLCVFSNCLQRQRTEWTIERKNSVTQTLRCMNSLSRRRAVNTHSPTEPRGHSVCVLSFSRRTVKRNYLRWSLWADSFILGQAHFVCSLE